MTSPQCSFCPIKSVQTSIVFQKLKLLKPTHHSDNIIEEAFLNHCEVELLIDGHKHGQHGHRVHGRNDGGKQQVLLEGDVLQTKSFNLAYGKQRQACANGVPQSPQYCKPQHLHTERNVKLWLS